MSVFAAARRCLLASFRIDGEALLLVLLLLVLSRARDGLCCYGDGKEESKFFSLSLSPSSPSAPDFCFRASSSSLSASSSLFLDQSLSFLFFKEKGIAPSAAARFAGTLLNLSFFPLGVSARASRLLSLRPALGGSSFEKRGKGKKEEEVFSLSFKKTATSTSGRAAKKKKKKWKRRPSRRL